MVSWLSRRLRELRSKSTRSSSSHSTAPVQPVSSQRLPSPEGRKTSVNTAQATAPLQPTISQRVPSPQGRKTPVNTAQSIASLPPAPSQRTGSPHGTHIASVTASQAVASRQPMTQPVTSPHASLSKIHRGVSSCCGKGYPNEQQLKGWLRQDGDCVAYCHSAGRKLDQIYCDTLYVLRYHSGQYQHIEKLLHPEVTAQIKTAYRDDGFLQGYRTFDIRQWQSGFVTQIGMLRKVTRIEISRKVT